MFLKNAKATAVRQQREHRSPEVQLPSVRSREVRSSESGCEDEDWRDQLIETGQIITTSAEVTLNGGLIRELPQNPLNSGLGIILICPD